MNLKIINILHMLMKNQIWTKFATQCQNADATFASHLLLSANVWQFFQAFLNREYF